MELLNAEKFNVAPVFNAISKVPPANVTVFEKVIVTFTSSPIPYVPAAVEDATEEIVGRVASICISSASFKLAPPGIDGEALNSFPNASVMEPALPIAIPLTDKSLLDSPSATT